MRRGVALLATLFVLLLLGALLAGLPWRLRAEARAAAEQLALVRAAAAAEAAVVLARRYLEATAPESLAVALAGMPPPVRLPGSALGYAEFDAIDPTLVEVVAQGFAGTTATSLARRQLCVLLQVGVVGDSAGMRLTTEAAGGGAGLPCSN